MQANRKPPSPEPQVPGLKRALHPSQDPSLGSQGVNSVAKGGGRTGMRGGRGGRQGVRGMTFGPSGRGHVHGGMSRQAQQKAGPQQNHVMASAQGGVSTSLQQQQQQQQQHITPAQRAIQQGKLQQQLDRKQQLPPQQVQQRQPFSSHRQQQQQQSGLQQQQHQQPQQQQQQQPQQQQGLLRHPQSMQQQQQQQPLNVSADSSMQGVQHSHWDTAYSGGPPRDPRQMPIGHNFSGRPGQVGSSHTSGGFNTQQPGRALPKTHQTDLDPLFEPHAAGIQQPNIAPSVDSQNGSRASASRGDQIKGADVLLQYPGAAQMGNRQSFSPMPAIPALSGQHDVNHHAFSRADRMTFSQPGIHMGHAAAVTRQGERRPSVNHTAADARAQMYDHPDSFPVEVTRAPIDPRRSLQTGSHSGGAMATQSTRSFDSSQLDNASPHKPGWANNRR